MDTYLIIFLRIITIMALLLGSTLFIMGKRPIGELPVFDFLVLVVMGSVVGADIADRSIEHLPTAFAILVLAGIQRLISVINLRFKKFRKLVTFEPTVVLYNGKLNYSNIKRINYNLDEVMMMLREHQIFDISKVEYGIIEANGSLSILNKPQHEKTTLSDLKLSYPLSSKAVTVIQDKKLQQNNIKLLGLEEKDIVQMINKMGYKSAEEIFHASVDADNNINISTYKESAKDYYSNTVKKE